MNDKWYLVDNEMGLFIRASREAKGYSMEEISRGICSIPTLSRIEAGERVVDYIMIEALLERMKISKAEYEFVLDNDDYAEYMKREEIRKLIFQKEYEQAEQKIQLYEKEHGNDELHRQFIFLKKGYLEKSKNQLEKEQIKELFQKAVSITSPEYQKILEQRGIFSDTELFCLVEMAECTENSLEREKEQKKLYEYFQWCHVREKLYPVPYRTAMRYYADCLYHNGKYEECIDICNQVLKELYGTSKLENRHKIFELRAKAKEKVGFQTEEEKKECLKDFLTAYYAAEFYHDEAAPKIKRHIEEVYAWQFIE